MKPSETLEEMAVIINKALDDGWGMAHGLQAALARLVEMRTHDPKYQNPNWRAENIGWAVLDIVELKL